jgi:hypothetical protein
MVLCFIFICMKHAAYFKLKEYKEYLKFIELCRTKSYDMRLVLHNHHIIPKHLWNDETKSVNNSSNMIKLSVNDHSESHLLLAKCYDDDTYEYTSNMRSARIISGKSIKDKLILDEISKTYIGEKNPFYGKTHSEETKAIISAASKKKWQGVSYENRYGVEGAEIERKKRSKKTRTDEQYREAAKKTAEKLKGRYIGEKNPAAQAYMVDELVFGCKNDMLYHFGISMYLLKKLKKIIRITKEEYNKLKK